MHLGTYLSNARYFLSEVHARLTRCPVIEARLWLEVVRVVCQRWERRHDIAATLNSPYEIETLWSNEDVQSVEVQNYVY